MTITWLDHVNIVTANLAVMSEFYSNVLGLKPGPRPPFDVDGCWHYLGEHAMVHLVDRPVSKAEGDLQVEHFAFRGVGLQKFLDTLRASDVGYRVDTVPGLGLPSVNVYDPDGNHIEILFSADETGQPLEWSPPSGD